jgi:2-polyprenyl-3-methyl-5-hydroxy-6-metoxy-1,4-benzoquinol methylase
MNWIKRTKNPNTKEFWESEYDQLIEKKKLRSDGDHLEKFKGLFQSADSIVDFGAGLGGNVQHIAGMLENTRFTLVDHSETSLNYAEKRLLGRSDERGNSFDYQLNMKAFPDESVGLILSIQVLEHITEYREIMDVLWRKVKPGGILLISVPVRGIRDTNRQHVNKFTINSMFKILTSYSDIIHMAPRTMSKRSGNLTTAYFYIQKKTSHERNDEGGKAN